MKKYIYGATAIASGALIILSMIFNVFGPKAILDEKIGATDASYFKLFENFESGIMSLSDMAMATAIVGLIIGVALVVFGILLMVLKSDKLSGKPFYIGTSIASGIVCLFAFITMMIIAAGSISEGGVSIKYNLMFEVGVGTILLFVVSLLATIAPWILKFTVGKKAA